MKLAEFFKHFFYVCSDASCSVGCTRWCSEISSSCWGCSVPSGIVLCVCTCFFLDKSDYFSRKSRGGGVQRQTSILEGRHKHYTVCDMTTDYVDTFDTERSRVFSILYSPRNHNVAVTFYSEHNMCQRECMH